MLEQINLSELPEGAEDVEGVPLSAIKAGFERTKRLHLAHADEGPYLLRPPTAPEVSRFMAQSDDAKNRYAALKNLALSCVLYPERARLEAIFEEYALLPSTLGSLALELAGGAREASLKKLGRG